MKEVSETQSYPSAQATCRFPVEITVLEVFYLPLSSFLTFLSDHNGVAWAAWAQGPPPQALAAVADLISAFAIAGAREGLGLTFLGTTVPAARETMRRGPPLLVPLPSWTQ